MAFDTIDDAFHYVSDAPPGERRALVHRPTGRVYLASLQAGYDEAPPGSGDDPDYLAIPHRRELDPGKPLVLEFVDRHCPGERTRVEALFGRPGAFRNLKQLLRRKGLFDLWEIFAAAQLELLLRQWCSEKGLTV